MSGLSRPQARRAIAHARRDEPQARREPPQAWVDHLRALHPTHTAKRVAGRTGLPPRTIEKWLAGETEPSAGALVRLIHAYGPEFLALLLPGSCDWLAAAARAARRAQIQADMDALAAQLGES